MFSDWRDTEPVDYSTNALVSQWYSGKPTKYFRQNEMKGFADRLNARDTVTLGIDYYALFNISKVWLDRIDPNIFYYVYNEIVSGEVVVIKIWFNGRVNWKRI